MKRAFFIVCLIGIALGGDNILLARGAGFSSAQQHEIASASKRGKARPASGALALSAAEPVVWSDLVKCAVSGGTLTKTSGRNDTADAGAYSQQQIASGDGYVEFKAVEINKERYIGLTTDFAGTNYATIDYSIHLTPIKYKNGYIVEVRENGAYKSETTYTSGSTFRIAVEGGVIKYYHNGAVFYTSKAAPKYPLLVDASFINVGATISGAMIGSIAPSTPPPPPADTQAPVISAVASSAITASEATITWTTNEPATSRIEYGTTTAYGMSAALGALVTAHRFALGALEPGTLYHYRVSSTDAAGNLSASGDLTFTTLQAADTTSPVISAVAVSAITDTSATITWKTDEPATSQVDYGVTTAYGSAAGSSAYSTSHSLTLSGLSASTIYHYRIRSADAAGNQGLTDNLSFTTAASSGGGSGGSGSTVAGLLDDNNVYLPANYTNFVPPAVGVPYPDSAFGTMITRLSDGMAQFGDGVHHEYATISPFNMDSSRILISSHRNGYYIVDRAGRVIVSSQQLQIGHSNEPRWSTTDPNVIYYHSGNQILKYDLATGQKSVVRTFTQFSSIVFGGGEGDLSDDGDHIVIIGNGRYVGLYQFSTGTLGATLDTSGLGGFDYFDVTANNNVIARWGKQGTGRYRGFELFDRNMNFIRQLTTFGAHADRGRDLNGDEVLIVAAYNDPNPPAGCENNGVEKVRLSDGKRTCLIGLDWNSEIHVSSNTNGSNPWVLVSVTDTATGTANPPQTLSSTWQSQWRVRYNEVILVRIDGSEKRRMAHHRTRTMDSYWFQPRATISRDGKYAIFDSNFGVAPISDFTDVFLLNLMKD